MTTVQTIKTPKDIVDLLDLRRSATGFQRAHIVGDAFAKRFKNQWFSKLFGKNLLGQNNAANGVLLPEASRGGFVLGASVHNQEHVEAFNSLFYDANPDTNGSSQKWMNRLERQLRRDLADEGLNLNTLDLDNPNEASVAKGGVKLERNTADQLIERQRPALRRPRLGS
jgi:A nuclease family of the HNH/ENDO VII superfamily with conserved AHH